MLLFYIVLLCIIAIVMLVANVVYPFGFPAWLGPTIVFLGIATAVASFGSTVEFKREKSKESQSLTRTIYVFGVPVYRRVFPSIMGMYFLDTREGDLSSTVESAALHVKYENGEKAIASSLVDSILVTISLDEAREFCKSLD